MDSYSSLFTSGLMALCETQQPRSRPASHQSKDSASGLRSFLSLEMAESLRTLTNSSASPTSSRSNSLMPERRARTVSTSSGPAKSALMTRRRSLPQPKPAPLAELPVLPTIRSRSNSESASPTAPTFDITPVQPEPKELVVPSSLKLELSSAPTTPGSRFPTTPTSSRAMSMLSPTTSSDAPWLPSVDPTSPDAWVDSFIATLSPAIGQQQPLEQSLGLQLPPHIPNIDALLDEHAPLPAAPAVPKMARARRPDRRNAPSRNTSVNSGSMRSSQASVSTSYRRVQRGGALAKLEGREPRSQWMSDEEDGTASAKYQPGLSLMPSMDFKSQRSYSGVPENIKQQLVPFTTEDLNSSFIDLSDDIVSRRGLSSFVS